MTTPRSQNPAVRTMKCSACPGKYSSEGLHVGQWHRGCTGSPRGKYKCDHSFMQMATTDPATGGMRAKCIHCPVIRVYNHPAPAEA